MSMLSQTVFITVLIALLSGCDEQERQARVEAQRREATALQQAQSERARREFWQTTTSVAGIGTVVFLIVGIAIGSSTTTRKQTGGQNGTQS